MSRNVKIPLKMDFLTPLHIGSGKAARLGQDVFSAGKDQLMFISFDKLLADISNDRMLFNRITEALSKGETIDGIISKERIKQYMVNTELDISTAHSVDISTFMKDARNNPFVPATTIKGGLRTLIMRAFLAEHSSVLNDFEKGLSANRSHIKQVRNMASGFENRIFGRDGQKDPLKSLRVEDAYFDAKNLAVSTVKVLDLSNNGESCGWRKAAGRKGYLESDIGRATPINVEVGFADNVKTAIYIDTFYVSHFKEFSGYKGMSDPEWFSGLFKDFYDKLAQYSKKFALQDIAYEKAFLEKYAKRCNVEQVIEQYNKLEKSVKDSNAIFMQIAWGIGWRGMGGSILSDGVALTLAHILNLDRGRNAAVFPKTRRYMSMFDKGTRKEYAKFPLGWVKLKKEKAI